MSVSACKIRRWLKRNHGKLNTECYVRFVVALIGRRGIKFGFNRIRWARKDARAMQITSKLKEYNEGSS